MLRNETVKANLHGITLTTLSQATSSPATRVVSCIFTVNQLYRSGKIYTIQIAS